MARRVYVAARFEERRAVAAVNQLSHEWLYLILLGLAVGYGIVNAGGRDVVAWNVCLLSIGVVGFSYSLSTGTSNLPRLESWIPWAALLPPAYVALQLVPLPLSVLRAISPARAEAVSMLGAVMPPPAFAAVSINPPVTLSYLVSVIAYALTFLLVGGIASRFGPRARWAAAVPLILIAAAEAWLGLAQATRGVDATAQGTYRNRNHFAGLLEMVLPLAIGFATCLILDRRARRLTSTLWALGGVVVAGIMLAALASSRSKMGFVAFFCGLLAAGVLALATSLRGPARWAGILGLAAVCLVVFVLLPADQFVMNFGQVLSATGDATEGRWPIALDALRLVRAYPLFGSGFGTFGTAFLRYQTALVEWDFTFAHNDYLEVFTELGVIGFVIFSGLMFRVLVRAIRAAAASHDWNMRALALGCAGAIAAIAVHSLTDFNMYIPANPLVLAWVAGIAVNLPLRPWRPEVVTVRRGIRRLAIALASVLVICAPARILAETTFKGNLAAEHQLCRFGICDMNGFVEAQGDEHGGTLSPARLAELLEAVRRSPAQPNQWAALGAAMQKAGRVAQARACFSNAQALGPNVPAVVWKSVNFYYDLGEPVRALEGTSWLLGNDASYDVAVFESYDHRQIPIADVFAMSLGKGERPSRAHLDYLIGARDFDRSALAWDRLIANRFADDRVARDYINFLYEDRRFEAAARAWARYLGDRAKGYRDTTWLFDGGFESEPSKSVFDWRLDNLAEDVQVAIDPDVARTGARSLRIRFAGKENVSYSNVSETTFVAPGVYKFEALVRAEGITTDQGVAFHVFDTEDSSRLNVTTERVTGTTDWKPIAMNVRVPPGTELITVQLVRQKSLKFDSHIAGSAWVDDVSLTRVQ